MDKENQNESSTVDGILRKIEEKADTGEYLYRGEPERADYNQAMRLTGQPAEAYYHRGNAYGMKGALMSKVSAIIFSKAVTTWVLNLR